MIVLSFALLLACAEVLCRISDKRNTFWRAVILWEGEYYTHKARSYAEACEWLACYPKGSAVIESVFHGNARIEGARHA